MEIDNHLVTVIIYCLGVHFCLLHFFHCPDKNSILLHATLAPLQVSSWDIGLGFF